MIIKNTRCILWSIYRTLALVWWLLEETRVPKVVSSNLSTLYWMDIFHIHICCKIFDVFEMTKIKEKEAGVGPFVRNKHFVNYDATVELTTYLRRFNFHLSHNGFASQQRKILFLSKWNIGG